mmetsp:Transcript_8107/g.25313  ORF Transcript_8107/g.25313 Transcript_8107/m.25313 type:complete len:133 (+) Transcript_8107:940-1338(+)|eukprot:scaffold257831_cov31-Tisochrysis_lutea.AAC.3
MNNDDSEWHVPATRSFNGLCFVVYGCMLPCVRNLDVRNRMRLRRATTRNERRMEAPVDASCPLVGVILVCFLGQHAVAFESLRKPESQEDPSASRTLVLRPSSCIDCPFVWVGASSCPTSSYLQARWQLAQR